MLEILILTGLGIAGGISWIGLNNAENKARNNAINKSYKFWTDSKGRQRDIKTGKVLTAKEIIGEYPQKGYKKKELYFGIFKSEVSYIDIIEENSSVKPLAVFKTKEDAEKYACKIMAETYGSNHHWMTQYSIISFFM